LQTPLKQLANFLDYAAQTDALKPIFASLAKDLAAPTSRKRLMERALETPLGDLATFLGYAAKTDALKPVFIALAKDLAAPASHEPLTKRALQTPLNDLANFLGYAAQTDALKPVFAALGNDLAASENRERLTERALQTPLGQLANFLGYAAQTDELKPVFVTLGNDLAASENRERLTKRALQTPLEQLANFLDYAAQTDALKPVFTALANDLSVPESRERLVERLYVERLHAIVAAFRDPNTNELMGPALSAIDLDRWTRIRGNETDDLESFVTFQRFAVEKGRPELAKVIADRIIMATRCDDWHRPCVHLTHFSHVLRHADSVDPTAVDHFISVIATPERIRSRLAWPFAGVLAGSILGIYTALGSRRRCRWLITDKLALRVRYGLSPKSADDVKAMAEGLSLLGAASVIGLQLSNLDGSWLEPRRLVRQAKLGASCRVKVPVGEGS